MKEITSLLLQPLMKQAGVKTRLRREVRFQADTVIWEGTELHAVPVRSGGAGVLLLQPSSDLYIVPYELSPGLVDATGRTKPITCDLCYTWQTGATAGSITFRYADRQSVTFLCCADLDCSRHVRTQTAAARLSRSQLREDIDTAGRVHRLCRRLEGIIAQMALSPIE